MLKKITLKTIFGDVAFEFEKENNTEKETVQEFLKQNADRVIRNMDLSNMDLTGIEFYNSKFDNSKFYNSKFDNSKFDNSTFDNSKFDNSTFYNSTFYNSTFYNSTFYNSKFDNQTILNIIENKQLHMFDGYKHDCWAVLLKAKSEIPALRQSLVEGRIDGSVYEGECCCLKGTIAKIQGCHHKSIPHMKADVSEPSEQWFLMIRSGMTPENSEVVKLTVAWIDEFLMFLNLPVESTEHNHKYYSL